MSSGRTKRMVAGRVLVLLVLGAGALVAIAPGASAVVAEGPVPQDDFYATPINTELDIAAPGVLANDDTFPGRSAVLDDDVTHGTLALNLDGSFTYTPDVDFLGQDTFTYHLGRTIVGAPYRPSWEEVPIGPTQALVTITVFQPNRPPVGNPDEYSTPQDTLLKVFAPGVLANDTDADGDSLTAVPEEGPFHGNATLNGDGSFNYTPAAGFMGDDTFTYHPEDNQQQAAAPFRRADSGNSTTVTIHVTAGSPPPRTTACPISPFTDVPRANVHAEDIDCLFFHHITIGETATTYEPDKSVSRGEIASFIVRLIIQAGGTVPADPPDAFTDDNGDPHEDNINELAALGIAQGKGGGLYDPTGTTTRGQIASLMVRAYEIVTGQELPVSQEDHFTDDNGNVHEHDINAAADAGFVQGFDDGTFQPNAPLARDQMASFLMREFDKLTA